MSRPRSVCDVSPFQQSRDPPRISRDSDGKSKCLYGRKRKWSKWESGGGSAFPPSCRRRTVRCSFVRRCGCAIASGTRNGTGASRPAGRPASPCAHWLINIVAELDSSEMGILIGNQCRPATTKPVRPSGKRFANANTVAPGSPRCRFFFAKILSPAFYQHVWRRHPPLLPCRALRYRGIDSAQTWTLPKIARH